MSLAFRFGVVIPLELHRYFCGAMGNAASSVAVVDVFLVRAQVAARRGTEAILLHWQYYSAYKKSNRQRYMKYKLYRGK